MPIREVRTNEIPDGVLDILQSKRTSNKPPKSTKATKSTTSKKQNNGLPASKPEAGLGRRVSPPALPPHLQDYVNKAKNAPKAKSPMDLVRMLHASNRKPPGY